MFDTIWQDIRYAVRTLRRTPAFTAAAILTLAIGIGANTAMFAVVNALLLKPLPFWDADRLMLLHVQSPDPEAGPGVWQESDWSYPKYRAFLEFQQTFDSTALFADREFDISGNGEPVRIHGEVITDKYPAILGIAPMIGRPFTRDETDVPGAQPVALLSHALWTRRYGADPSIVGRAIQVNGAPHTVIGVVPRGFRGLSGNADIWVPLAILEPRNLGANAGYSHSYYLVARRKPATTEQAAVSATRVYGAQVDAAFPDRYPDPNTPWGASAVSLYDSRADADVRLASIVLLGTVGFVLLIACVNLTNLFVARTLSRGREIAVRAAIGASRFRITRQVLVEALLLTCSGAAIGLMAAGALLRGATALLPESDVFFRSPIAPGVPRIAGAPGLTRIGAAMVAVDAPVLAFTCGIAVFAGVLIALVPAVTVSSLRPIDVLKSGGNAGAAGGLGRFGARSVLVTAQIALAVVLLSGAGLMVKSAFRLQATDIGVRTENVLTARIALPRTLYDPGRGTGFFLNLVDRLHTAPGVESVALGSCIPVSGGGCSGTSLWFPRQGPPQGIGRDSLVGIHWATPDYFALLGLEVTRGRGFTRMDRPGQPKVAIVNEEAARALWPNTTPIGQIIAVGQGGFDDGAEVIGVVSNARYRTIETAPRADVYVPLAQSYQARMVLFVRGRTDPANLTASVRQAVRALDPTLPLSEVKTMAERLGDAMWRTRVATWLFSGFAALALLLTAIGVFGVVSHTVSQRTREIGLRMALGAHARDVLQLVVMRAAVFTAVGIVIGVVLALGLTNVITALLYQVQPGDPSTLISVAALIGAVSLLACGLPALRATRVDPMTILRAE